VDLGRLHSLYELVTYGDSTSPKWVASYNLNYTIDLAMVNWKTATTARENDVTKNNNVIACTYLAYCYDFSLLMMPLSPFLFVDTSRKQCLQICS
jgi:hypothetical protein